MISPCWVRLAKTILVGSGVKVATTVNFPQATDTTEMKVVVTRLVAKEGADEFDFPPNPAFLLSGMEEEYYTEIATVTKAGHEEGLVVKAMLEFGYLINETMKAKATSLASKAGVDWVKQSSGWGKGGIPATVDDVRILKANISGITRIKVSGKVNSFDKMDALFSAGAELVGTSSGPAILDGIEDRVSEY
jgi:deoxyribose-phosphate aldolase